MKILEPGPEPIPFTIEVICKGNDGDDDPGCGAKFLVEQADLRGHVFRIDQRIQEVWFDCISCGAANNINRTFTRRFLMRSPVVTHEARRRANAAIDPY